LSHERPNDLLSVVEIGRGLKSLSQTVRQWGFMKKEMSGSKAGMKPSVLKTITTESGRF